MAGSAELTRWVAFLRGIAPANTNQKNVQLREVCEELGFSDVASVQSSGNLLFGSESDDRAALEAQLEAAWPEQLGFRSTSILRRCDELRELTALEPFGEREHGRSSYLLVTFAKGELPTTDLPEPPQDAAFELLGSTGRELFTVTDTTGRAGTPDTMAWLESQFGKDISSRTWPTVHRILAKCPDASG